MNVAIRNRSTDDRTSRYDYTPAQACLEMLERAEANEAVEVTRRVPATFPASPLLSYPLQDQLYPQDQDVNAPYLYIDDAMGNFAENLKVFRTNLVEIETASLLLQRYLTKCAQIDTSHFHALILDRYVPSFTTREVPESALIQAILALSPVGAADEGELARGESAKSDAIEFVARYCANSMAAADLSDGVVSLHWRKGTDGLMLIFVGDRQAEFSVHGGNRQFTDNATLFSIDEPLPAELTELLHRIVQK